MYTAIDKNKHIIECNDRMKAYSTALDNAPSARSHSSDKICIYNIKV